MTKFVKSIRGHVSLAGMGKYLPEGKVFPLTNEEALMEEVVNFRKLGYLIVADTKEEVEKSEYTPIHLQPVHINSLHPMHFELEAKPEVDEKGDEPQQDEKEVFIQPNLLAEEKTEDESDPGDVDSTEEQDDVPVVDEDEDLDPISAATVVAKPVVVLPKPKAPVRRR